MNYDARTIFFSYTLRCMYSHIFADKIFLVSRSEWFSGKRFDIYAPLEESNENEAHREMATKATRRHIPIHRMEKVSE